MIYNHLIAIITSMCYCIFMNNNELGSSHLTAINDKNLRMFIEREEHTDRISFEQEQILFNHIKNGDVDSILLLVKDMKDGRNGKLKAGRMSSDSLRQAQYTAVTLTALGIRYAIKGGLSETEAYSMSDYFIQQIDLQKSSDSVMFLILEMIITLTLTVQNAKSKQAYSIYTKKAIDYIYKNLHYKITLPNLSRHCGISEEYLSRVFKKDVGITVSAYIVKEKLEVAQSMLLVRSFTSAEIAHTLGFCSQSHFIDAFKKQYHITPKQFLMTRL